jgi:hypothetical protein
VTVTDLKRVFAGQTSSVVLSGDGNTAAAADGLNYTERVRGFDTGTLILDEPDLFLAQDAAISRNGGVVLLADRSSTLIRYTGFTTATPTKTTLTGPAGVCFYEVALTSHGNTAVGIGRVSNVDGCFAAFHVYRLDGVLSGSPTFTDVSTAGSGVSYTDVAISEDGKTVIVGKINGDGSAGIERVTDFNTATPVVRSDQNILVAGCVAGINTVDVDLSADGMTAIAGVAGCSTSLAAVIIINPIFQILDADLSSSISAPMATPSNLEGVALNSGGSIALVRVNYVSTPSISVTRFDGFNLPSPTATDFDMISLPSFNTTTPARKQDQIDLQ